MVGVRLLTRVLLTAFLLYMGAWGYRIYLRKYWYWLPAYAAWSVTPSETATEPVHVFLLAADHFEPGMNSGIVQRWLDEYPAIARRHHDSTGRPLQHTWFYPAEQPIDANLAALRSLVSQ